jgi:hypothetical protein
VPASEKRRSVNCGAFFVYYSRISQRGVRPRSKPKPATVQLNKIPHWKWWGILHESVEIKYIARLSVFAALPCLAWLNRVETEINERAGRAPRLQKSLNASIPSLWRCIRAQLNCRMRPRLNANIFRSTKQSQERHEIAISRTPRREVSCKHPVRACLRTGIELLIDAKHLHSVA